MDVEQPARFESRLDRPLMQPKCEQLLTADVAALPVREPRDCPIEFTFPPLRGISERAHAQ